MRESVSKTKLDHRPVLTGKDTHEKSSDVSGISSVLLSWGFIAVILAGLPGCVSDDGTALSLPETTPVAMSVEATAEDKDHAQLVKAFGGEYNDAKARNYLESVVARIVPATERPNERYRITILNSPVINAFALPNGRLYVTRGLLALASDTSEIAAVMAHEIAHVTLRHAAARTELELRSALMTRVVADVLQDSDGSTRVRDRSKVTIAGFSRAQELDADKIGVKTLATAGYDPYGATRFLKALERSGSGTRGGSDMLSTHPSTKERIDLTLRAARQLGAPGIGARDKDAYLAAINGLAYGEDPSAGIVRGRRFIHTGLHIAFEAPPGFQLENSPKAVLGTESATGMRLLFDVVESSDNLENVLRNTWSDSIEPENFRTETVNGLATTIASATGSEWHFRLAAIRGNRATFRIIVASKSNGSELDRAFRDVLGSVRPLSEHDIATATPLHIRIVKANAGDNLQSMADKMATDKGYERFLLLNGLDSGQDVHPGDSYKIVTE